MFQKFFCFSATFLVVLALSAGALIGQELPPDSSPDGSIVVGGPEAIDLDAWIQGQDGGYGYSGGGFGSRFGGSFGRRFGGGFGGGYGLSGDQGDPGILGPWSWQLLPEESIYRTYLAGAHEPRMSVTGVNERNAGWLWDSSLGAKLGIVRYGSPAGSYPQGFQFDIEGAVFVRQFSQGQLVATDYRIGLPLTFGFGRYQTKFGYYHLSSHLGDEFLISTGLLPGARINFVRNSLVWGHSYQWNSALRAYFEIGYAYDTDGGSQPWEFQFGAEFSPLCHTGFRGAPFAAANVHLREELDFSGNFVFQAGWQWRRRSYGPLLRTGLQYYNGLSPRREFFTKYEHQLGFGVWYDF